MSKEALAKVVQRSISDAAFRRQLATDPSGALRGYDLSGDEKSALRSGDPGRLTAFGVEQRMSKAFTLTNDGSTNPGSISNVSTSDLSPMGSGALTTGDAVVGSSVNSAMTAGDGSASSSVLSSGDGMVGGAVVNAATTAGDGPMASTIVPGDPMQFGGALTSSEPRDIAPVWVGDGSASGDAALISSEPRDFAPTDLSDGQALSSVIPSDSATSFNSDQLSQGAVTDEGFLPSVGYATDNALMGNDGPDGATTTGEASDGPEIQP